VTGVRGDASNLVTVAVESCSARRPVNIARVHADDELGL
jgi:hypothetical protein